MLDETQLRALFDKAVAASGAFGAQLSVSQGAHRLDFAAGTADARRGAEMTIDTTMQIGSITKVFNASLVMQLVGAGALDLDTPVHAYLPGFRVDDPEATKTITPRHLLSMSSGLDNGPYLDFGTGADALGRYVARLDTLPQHFPPGRYLGYSNAGACIAGHLAATVAGSPWETLLRDRIIGPAALDSAVLLDEEAVGRRVSHGHTREPDAAEPTVVAPLFSKDRAQGPSGAAFALAIRDLARFGRVFLDGGLADTGARVLDAASVRQMMTRHIDLPTLGQGRAWGLGMVTDDWNGVEVWGHGGSTLASVARLVVIPEHDAVVAFGLNTRAAYTVFQKIVFTELLDAAFDFTKPRIDIPAEPLPRLDPARYAGTYESVNMTIRVTGETDGVLDAVLAPRWSDEELAIHDMASPDQALALLPVGGDRFLIRAANGPDPYQGEEDVAFFGDDGTGRPTHFCFGVMAMSRRAA